jgi:hypothetical protein
MVRLDDKTTSLFTKVERNAYLEEGTLKKKNIGFS